MLFGCVAGFRGWSLTTSTDNVGELATQRPIWAWPSTLFFLGFSSVESPKGLSSLVCTEGSSDESSSWGKVASVILQHPWSSDFSGCLFLTESFPQNALLETWIGMSAGATLWRSFPEDQLLWVAGRQKGSKKAATRRFAMKPLLSRWRWPGRWRFSCGWQMSDKLLRGAPQFYRLMNRRHLWWQTFFANTHRTIFSILSTSASGAMSGGAGDNSPLALVPLQGISEKYLGYINYDEIRSWQLDMISKKDLHLTLRRT